jgi:hypothetical protein
MVKTTSSPYTSWMKEHFTIWKYHNFHHYYNIMYEQMFLKHLIWTSQLEKKLKVLVKKIIFHGFFLHVQNSMDKLLLNLVFHIPFTIATLWQGYCNMKMYSNLFVFAPISWYNDILGCKPRLIEIFNYKMFSKHQSWYIKVP